MKNKLVMWDDLLLLDYIGDIEDRYIPEYDCFEYSDSWKSPVRVTPEAQCR